MGQVSTIMRLLTSKDSDLSSCFDKNEENALDKNNLLKQIIINNQGNEVKKEELKDNYPRNIYLGFVKHLRR